MSVRLNRECDRGCGGPLVQSHRAKYGAKSQEICGQEVMNIFHGVPFNRTRDPEVTARGRAARAGEGHEDRKYVLNNAL
jgi:hypothetical protein